MKLRLLFSITISLLTLCSTHLLYGMDTAPVDAKIKLAVEYLLKSNNTEVEAQRGFIALVEAIVLTAPESGYPEEFGKKIAEAKKRFESGSITDEKGITLLRDSFLLINSGKGFYPPAGISSIEQAVEYCRKQIEFARGSLKQGKINQCAKALLEVALMITTPTII
jgi:hypothetical protein